jgi:hypothetical protein
MSSVTSDVCKRGEFICFTCVHAPSSTATFFTSTLATSSSCKQAIILTDHCVLKNVTRSAEIPAKHDLISAQQALQPAIRLLTTPQDRQQ